MALIPILIFGGLVIRLPDIPAYISWFKYLSPLRCSLIILFRDQLETKNFQQYPVEFIIKYQGLDEELSDVYINLWALLGGYFVLSLGMLYVIRKKI